MTKRPPKNLTGSASAPLTSAPPDVTDARDSAQPRANDRRTRAARNPQDAGREAAISHLFDRDYTQLLRLALLLGASGVDAEDIVAEAFCQLHRRWRSLRNPLTAGRYLRSTVCNLTRMHVRRMQVFRRYARKHVEEYVNSAEQQVLLRDDQRAVVRALRSLPVRQREALVLRYWLGLNVSEIAGTMGISSGAVKSHTSRGMARLIRLLKGDAE